MIQPIDTSGFQAKLEAACRDTGLALRVVWAPSRIRSRLIVNGQRRIFMVYPDVTKQAEGYILGEALMRAGQQVGYCSAAGIVSGDTWQPGDIYLPDIEVKQPSRELFIIEQEMYAPLARKLHDKYRRMCVQETGIDGFGEFPADGWWNYYDEISEHRDGCCEATGQGICWGLYREPDDADIERVQRALHIRSQESRLRDLEEPPTQREIEQWSKDRTRQIAEWERKDFEERASRLGEELGGRLKARFSPHVFMDSTKRMKDVNISD